MQEGGRSWQMLHRDVDDMAAFRHGRDGRHDIVGELMNGIEA
jgi:hypothetical protein